MGWSPPCISGIEKHSAGALPTASARPAGGAHGCSAAGHAGKSSERSEASTGDRKTFRSPLSELKVTEGASGSKRSRMRAPVGEGSGQGYGLGLGLG